MSDSSFPTNAQREILWTTLTVLAILLLLGLVTAVFYGFVLLLEWSYPILLPLGASLLIALLLDPAISYLSAKWKLGRIVSTLLVSCGALILLALFLTLVVPSLIQQTGNYLRNDFPNNISTAAHFITTALPDTKTWMDTNLNNWRNGIEQNSLQLVNKGMSSLYNVLSPLGSIFGFIFGFGFVPIYTFYFLTDRDNFQQNWASYIPLRKDWGRDEVVSLIAEIFSSLVNYFRGQMVVAACNGVLTFIGLMLIGIPNSLFLGFIAGVFSVVPFLGVILSIIPALLLALASPGGLEIWVKPVLVLGVFALVQMSESVFVTPRVQSESTGLHPLAIILGIIFWSMILPGILGPIVAVPLTCTLVVIMRRYFWQKEEAPGPKKEEVSTASAA